MWNRFTWNLRMSRGFPAFFRQFWLHLRKNFKKNLKESTRQRQKLVIIKPLKVNHQITKLENILVTSIKPSNVGSIHPVSQKQTQHNATSVLRKWPYLSFPQSQEHPSICHLIASPEFMGLSQHPSATNIQEVTWYSTHLFNPRTPPVQLKFSCSIGKQMRPTCDQVLFEEHQG